MKRDNGQLGSGDYEEELIQYGEMLTLLEEQQEMIVNRSADGLIQNLTAIHSQMAEIAKVRDKRDEQRRDLQPKKWIRTADIFGIWIGLPLSTNR